MAKWGRRGWRSSRRRRVSIRLSRGKVWLLIVAIALFFFFQFFVFVERNLRGPLMNVATVRVKQVATQAINKAITEQVATETDAEKLIDWKTNSTGKISGFMINYGEHMRIRSETTQTVQDTLNDLGAIPEHVPVGQALGSAIISSFGPRVPVKFEPMGSVKVDLNTRQKEAGINMILVEVYMRIIAEVSIIIPFDTKPELVETEIPISYLLVVGDVPMYYYDNKGNPVGDSAQGAPAISLPSTNEGVSRTAPGSEEETPGNAEQTESEEVQSNAGSEPEATNAFQTDVTEAGGE
ncbi:sporulation protein YunB [Paenibacillus phyllosphaerae]|uniref:Sporulation protein YunB n=1 Tax=Paenibacillus phyllosphaerae TaxID=274593 RepID=A0A7W5FQ63_9BACL|nr:sporulation protein YunB [Paenibacillus phyllosphaerae]MBB3112902.1 sporulation protein YunB [Paenibacillus phyllosphaerae]